MAGSKMLQKSVTPGSVRALMVVETVIIGFLAFWLYSEYAYNAYFQTYVNSMFLEHLTTYTATIGAVIGLSGSAAAITLWRSMRQARGRLETVAPLKIRGSVERLLSSLPAIDEPAASTNPVITTRGSRGPPGILANQSIQTVGSEEEHSSRKSS